MSENNKEDMSGLIKSSNFFDEKLENSIKYLWEEINIFLKNDSDYKIEDSDKNTLIVRCITKDAFSDLKIMEKIFGRIIFSDCIFNLEKKTIRAKNPKKDEKIFNFRLILEKRINYEGSIIFKK